MGEKKKFKTLAAALTFTVILIAAAIVLIVVSYFDSAKRNIAERETENTTQNETEESTEFYNKKGGDRLVYDSLSGHSAFFVFQDVPKNTYERDNFVTRNGYSFYKENGEVKTALGIDVSEFQGEIDWNAVRESGVEFAIIRIGYRTYGTGEIIIDNRYAENLENAQNAGIKTGVYFFSQAVSEKEAKEEADTVLDLIKDYDITYPVVFDWELVGTDTARTDKTTVSQLADYCIAFCKRVEEAGYTPMVYQNKNTALKSLDLTRLEDYDFWLAEYDEKPSYDYEYTMWQYSPNGKVPGIDSTVDMNISFVRYGETEESETITEMEE